MLEFGYTFKDDGYLTRKNVARISSLGLLNEKRLMQPSFLLFIVSVERRRKLCELMEDLEVQQCNLKEIICKKKKKKNTPNTDPSD